MILNSEERTRATAILTNGSPVWIRIRPGSLTVTKKSGCRYALTPDGDTELIIWDDYISAVACGEVTATP